jgi:hypothetical protein
MGHRKIQPPARADLPPVFCGRQDAASVGIRHFIVASLVAANFLLAMVVLLNEFPSQESTWELRKDLQRTACSAAEVGAVLIFTAILPAVVVCTIFFSMPPNGAVLAAMPLAIVLVISFILSCRMLQVAIRYETGAANVETSLYFVLSMGSLFATLSAALGLVLGVSLALSSAR